MHVPINKLTLLCVESTDASHNIKSSDIQAVVHYNTHRNPCADRSSAPARTLRISQHWHSTYNSSSYLAQHTDCWSATIFWLLITDKSGLLYSCCWWKLVCASIASITYIWRVMSTVKSKAGSSGWTSVCIYAYIRNLRLTCGRILRELLATVVHSKYRDNCPKITEFFKFYEACLDIT